MLHLTTGLANVVKGGLSAGSQFALKLGEDTESDAVTEAQNAGEASTGTIRMPNVSRPFTGRSVSVHLRWLESLPITLATAVWGPV